MISKEPSAARVAELGIESIDLEDLVHHRASVNADMHLEQVQQMFRSLGVEFLAVEREGRVVGMCARGQVGFVMSSRYGFAIYSNDSIETLMIPRPLVIRKATPIREVLPLALLRKDEEFKQDVVLVDAEDRLLGLIKVEVLAQLQSRLVSEQLEALQRQHETLRLQNLELFRANNAARQSQGLYLGLFASHTLGVALLDERGGIHEYNVRLAELLGEDDEALESRALTSWIIEAERRAFLKLLESHARGLPAPENHEFTFQIPARGPRIVRCSLGYIKETGQICACLDDLTEQRALERNLIRQEKQTLLDTLVGGIAHELNNKLAPVMGFSELLQEEADAEDAEIIALIIKSVDEAARIIRQLLEMSKPATPSVAPYDLRMVAEETLAILRFELRDAGCTVETRFPSTPVVVVGDPGQMKQVVLNLAINAIHAMEGREHPVLGIELRAGAARQVELVVSDNGCGIEPENLGRIFDPFFTTKGPEKGTGLGLSVCLSIVQQHDGDIRVESDPGVGTEFIISLPVDARASIPGTAAPMGRPAQKQPAASGARVLVVEDEIVIRRLLQEILSSKLGCRVEVAGNGSEALDVLKQGHFSLILADIRMPIMSGTELYLRLRETRPELAKNFVFVTGNPSDHHLDPDIARWKVPVITKPFTIARITEVCGPLLFGQEAPMESAAGPGSAVPH